MRPPESGFAVFTVGHSTRSLPEFMTLLKAHSVDLLIDVRTVPRSRHNPRFGRDTLPAALAGRSLRPGGLGAELLFCGQPILDIVTVGIATRLEFFVGASRDRILVGLLGRILEDGGPVFLPVNGSGR